jgi:predicted Zn-dependent protease
MTRPADGRRAFMRSACRHCLALGAFGAGARAFAQAVPELPAALPTRFTRPAVDTDEGGLWAIMDREETRLRRSSFAVHDEALTRYLTSLVCKLAGDHCPDARVHVVRTPYFNASMAPNGMMQVWTGLLLRVDNEAQLAAVLGHEMGHYLSRHTLERMRDVKSKTAVAAFMGMFGLVGAIAQIGVVASAFAFSREQEQQADRWGMKLMRDAGYDCSQAAQVWDNLIEELKVTGGADAGKRSALFATHPPAADRRDELMRLAGASQGALGADEYRAVIAPHRLEWLKDEVRRGQYEESLVLFGRMLKREPDDAQALFARGEVYRLRDAPGDTELALADLSRATAALKAPPDAFRSLGLVHRRRSDTVAAGTAFQQYLALEPDSADAALIKTYLTESKP